MVEVIARRMSRLAQLTRCSGIGAGDEYVRDVGISLDRRPASNRHENIDDGIRECAPERRDSRRAHDVVADTRLDGHEDFPDWAEFLPISKP